MVSSQKSKIEKINLIHQRLIKDWILDEDKEILNILFTMTDSRLITRKGLLLILKSLKSYQKEKLLLEKKQFGAFSVDFELSEKEFSDTIRFAENRKSKKQIATRFEGRKNKINKIIFRLKKNVIFSAEFNDECHNIANSFAFSTIMKALKLFCNNL